MSRLWARIRKKSSLKESASTQLTRKSQPLSRYS